MPEDSNIAGTDAAFGSLIYDVCGPTAKYLGGELRSYAEVGIDNLKRVFRSARHQLRIVEKTDGQVPPRILHNVLVTGYFCEDELQASYLGGVLASSKGPTSRDDRGVAYLALIDGLSSYQLRTHFILYSSILRADEITLHGQKIKNDLLEIPRRLAMHGLTVGVAESDYRDAMDFSPEEPPEIISEHAFIGLEQKGLSKEGTRVVNSHPNIPSIASLPPFRFFYPTELGIELFLWGLGCGERGLAGYKPDLLETRVTPIYVKPLFVELNHLRY